MPIEREGGRKEKKASPFEYPECVGPFHVRDVQLAQLVNPIGQFLLSWVGIPQDWHESINELAKITLKCEINLN
jgi:hypothetical protein